MPSELIDFKFEHLSVGSALQNFAFYSLVLLMLLIIIVQTNVHHETGIRKFIIGLVTRFSDVAQAASHTLYFRLRELFISRN
jgi:hypothetical protein